MQNKRIVDICTEQTNQKYAENEAKIGYLEVLNRLLTIVNRLLTIVNSLLRGVI